MPSKSKRNRRYNPQGKNITDSPVATGGEAMAQTIATQPAGAVAYKNNVKEAPTAMLTDSSHFLSELKWIGLVTLIVVILLIASYYIFR
jgi:hypothetical protein